MQDPAIHQFLIALLRSVTALLIVLNPIGLVPIVASVIGDLDLRQQRRMVRQIVLIGSMLLLVFTFAGTGILAIFRITINDLRIAGGLLLLSIGFSFVLKGSITSDSKLRSNRSPAPIASPILVGPGAITTAVVLVATNGVLVTSAAVAIVSAITWLIFRWTPSIFKSIGESGADVIVRIMGILLAAIAVVYVREGIVGIIKSFR